MVRGAITRLASAAGALTVAFALCLGMAPAAQAAPKAAVKPTSVQITATVQTQNGGFVRTEYSVRAGAHPLDRFKMVRLIRDGAASHLRGSILFLPPLGLTFSFYEQRDTNGAPGSSMTVSGSLAFQAGAIYLVQVNPSTASSANVTGTATLGGATVKAMFANGSYVAKQYTILTAAGHKKYWEV